MIEDTAFSNSADVEYLSLRWNKLRRVQPAIFYSLYKLKVLDLRDNLIPEIDLSSINHLKIIDVSNNPLQIIQGLVIGENTKDAVFTFKNTSISTVDFCVKQSIVYRDRYASVYVGVGHKIICNCALMMLQPFTVGNTCIRLSPDLDHCPSMPSSGEWQCTSAQALENMKYQSLP